MDDCLIELCLLGIGDVVEFHDEISVEVEKDPQVVDEFIHDLEGSLRIDDGGFTECVLEVVNDLNVGLLYVPLLFDFGATLHEAGILHISYNYLITNEP